MIEINKYYKLKKIKGFKNDDDSNYKVFKIVDNFVLCKNEATNESFTFMKEHFIDPDKPNEIYFELIERTKNENDA